MDFGKMPIGFAMALARNQNALVEFGKLSEDQRKILVDRAHNATSESEMYRIVEGLVR